MTRLAENTPVGRYTVHRFIKEGLYNDTYVLKDGAGRFFFMKLYDMERVPEKLKKDDSVQEIILSRDLSHPNVISYVEDGILTIEGTKYPYLVAPFFRGMLLSEAIRSGRTFDKEEAISIIGPILDGLAYLHNKNLCHNDVTPRNILLEEGEEGKLVPRIIDLGHLNEPVFGVPPFPREDLNIQYLAPEALKGAFSPDSDVYSAAAVLYAMLFGKAPWTVSIAEEAPFIEKKNAIRAAWKEELNLPENLDEQLALALKCGLATERRVRPDARKFKSILGGEKVEAPKEKPSKPSMDPPQKPPKADKEKEVGCEVRKNETGKGGFADVAGMEALKEDLTKRVIWILKDREKAAKYKLTPPNGLLLYGPPGCGKTFFAQKFAEETGFNYYLVNGSDLGSTYVHGTQGKIAELFKKAEKNAPSVICFDEFDSFVPSRGSESATHRADEVNEFLSQLNNCAARGIFVIGTTNRIDMIDPAVLRKGRLDLQFEIPAPDLETRKKMFQLHLKGRPCADDIDLDALAAMTDNYAASDIAFIVNEAAMVAALQDADISNEIIQESIRCNKSSLPPKKTINKIGF